MPKISPSDGEPSGLKAWDNGAYRGQTDISALWRESGVPERHRAKHKAVMDSASGPWLDAYQRLTSRAQDGALIVLLGKRGTGKTQLAVALMAGICKTGQKVRYLKAMDLFRELRNCYRKDGPSEVESVNQLCRLGCLVIDEAHERSDSDWENRTLTNIIDRRYDAVKCTILASNMTREAFGAAIGPSAVSRINECGEVVVCDWASFRG